MKEIKIKSKNGPSITYRYEEGISDEKAAEAVSGKYNPSPEKLEEFRNFLLKARSAAPEEWPLYMEKMGDLLRKIFLVNTDINYITPRVMESWFNGKKADDPQANEEEIDTLFHCNYFSASEILKKHDAEHEKIDDPDPLSALMANIRSLAALTIWRNFSCSFFFATHTDLKPSGRNCLTEQNKTDLIKIHEQMKAFLHHYFEEHGEPEDINDDWNKAAAAAFHEFVESYERQNGQNEIAIDAKSQAIITQAIRLSSLLFPIDKVNSTIWGVEMPKGENQLKAEANGSSKELNIVFSIDFDEINTILPTPKQLTRKEKRIYIAISSLFDAGKDVITLTQIHYASGGMSRPSQKDLEKINESIRKMSDTNIYINNESEAAVYTNYPKFVYRGKLLPMEQVTAIVNGKTAESAIHLFREPPLMSFAKQHNKQITTIPIGILQSPISKTEANLALEDYLLTRIARCQNGNCQAKILYKTICEKTNCTTRKQRERMPEKVKKLLDYYVTQEYINGYSEDHTGITISTPKKKKN